MRLTPLLLLLIAVALAYAPGLHAPSVFDDRSGVTQGPGTADFLNPRPPAAPGIPLPSYAYRPLTEASFLLNRRLAGPGVEGLRLGNLLIHVTAAWMAFLLARRLLGTRAAPWAALCFALHPMGVPAVTYLYQRGVALEALLTFATLTLYLGGRRGWAWLAALLAMGTKESAVTLPLTLAAVEWILRKPEEAWAARLKRWLPFALLPLIPLVQVLRAAHQAGLTPGPFTESGFYPVPSGTTPVQYLLLELPILLRYLLTSAFPFPLHFCHDQVLAVSRGMSSACGAVLLGLGAWVLLGPERHRLPRLALALFLAPLALESSLFPIRDLAFLHRCYPGLLGTAFLFAWAADGLRGRLLPGAALMLMLAMTARENGVWADPSALLSRDVRHARHVGTAWAAYARLRIDDGQPAHAERLFRQAMRLPYYDSEILAGHARALTALGRRAEARGEIAAGLRAAPGQPSLLRMAADISTEENDLPAQARLAARIAALALPTPALSIWLAQYRLRQGDPAGARQALDRSLADFPNYPPLWEHLGWVMMQEGKLDEAESALRHALDLDPTLAKTRYNLELVLKRKEKR